MSRFLEAFTRGRRYNILDQIADSDHRYDFLSDPKIGTYAIVAKNPQGKTRVPNRHLSEGIGYLEDHVLPNQSCAHSFFRKLLRGGESLSAGD